MPEYIYIYKMLVSNMPHFAILMLGTSSLTMSKRLRQDARTASPVRCLAPNGMRRFPWFLLGGV